MLLALHTISGALRMLSPVPPEVEAPPEAETDRPEAEGGGGRTGGGGIIDWTDYDESETVRIRLRRH